MTGEDKQNTEEGHKSLPLSDLNANNLEQKGDEREEVPDSNDSSPSGLRLLPANIPPSREHSPPTESGRYCEPYPTEDDSSDYSRDLDVEVNRKRTLVSGNNGPYGPATPPHRHLHSVEDTMFDTPTPVHNANHSVRSGRLNIRSVSSKDIEAAAAVAAQSTPQNVEDGDIRRSLFSSASSGGKRPLHFDDVNTTPTHRSSRVTAPADSEASELRPSGQDIERPHSPRHDWSSS